MNKTRRLILAIGGIGQICLLLIAFARPAYAYADPGTGLLMVQIGGSMLAGACLFIRHKLRRIFGIGAKSGDAVQEQGTAPEPER
ncbi:MAG TPA: hypothetical protein VKT75_12650 [Acidobacteriaceae bacterium]|nr:hypothetical protein [Acidobacteriaceae bacterium]